MGKNSLCCTGGGKAKGDTVVLCGKQVSVVTDEKDFVVFLSKHLDYDFVIEADCKGKLWLVCEDWCGKVKAKRDSDSGLFRVSLKKLKKYYEHKKCKKFAKCEGYGLVASKKKKYAIWIQNSFDSTASNSCDKGTLSYGYSAHKHKCLPKEFRKIIKTCKQTCCDDESASIEPIDFWSSPNWLKLDDCEDAHFVNYQCGRNLYCCLKGCDCSSSSSSCSSSSSSSSCSSSSSSSSSCSPCKSSSSSSCSSSSSSSSCSSSSSSSCSPCKSSSSSSSSSCKPCKKKCDSSSSSSSSCSPCKDSSSSSSCSSSSSSSSCSSSCSSSSISCSPCKSSSSSSSCSSSCKPCKSSSSSSSCSSSSSSSSSCKPCKKNKPCKSKVIKYKVKLDPKQEKCDCKVKSCGSGRAHLYYDCEKQQLHYCVYVKGLTSKIVAAHFHCGKKGKCGPVVKTLCPFVKFDDGKSKHKGCKKDCGKCKKCKKCQKDKHYCVSTGVWTCEDSEAFTQKMVKLLKKGHLYLNVHTLKYPDGEIRGQICHGRKGKEWLNFKYDCDGCLEHSSSSESCQKCDEEGCMAEKKDHSSESCEPCKLKAVDRYETADNQSCDECKLGHGDHSQHHGSDYYRTHQRPNESYDDYVKRYYRENA